MLLHVAGLWEIGLVVSAVTAVTFLAIAALIGLGLWRQRRWRSNPLAAGTFLIFMTCGGGHLIHTLQLMAPTFGWSGLAGGAARIHYGDWHLWVADGATAAAGVAYWLVRGRLAGLVEGAAIYEDLRARRRRAAVLQDRVVQEMAQARFALQLGDRPEARAWVERAEASMHDLGDDA